MSSATRDPNDDASAINFWTTSPQTFYQIRNRIRPLHIGV